MESCVKLLLFQGAVKGRATERLIGRGRKKKENTCKLRTHNYLIKRYVLYHCATTTALTMQVLNNPLQGPYGGTVITFC